MSGFNTSGIKQRVRGVVLPAALGMGRLGLTPNMLTFIGFLMVVAVGVVLGFGYFQIGGILFLLTTAFDMFDGALARATNRVSKFGAFFDSSLDRWAEAAIFGGMLIAFLRMPGDHFWEIVLIYAAIIGSLMVSYTRARAEGLGFTGDVGILQRPERIVILAVGLIVPILLLPALILLVVFTHITAIQRIIHVYRLASQTGKQE